MVREAALYREGQVILQTEHLSRVVGDTHLLDDISVQVQQGSIVAIVGPSGAGKSSFLRLLNRLDEPSAGTVLLDGKDYRTNPPQV
jgi:putative ABC transport system ATP-binding protein